MGNEWCSGPIPSGAVSPANLFLATALAQTLYRAPWQFSAVSVVQNELRLRLRFAKKLSRVHGRVLVVAVKSGELTKRCLTLEGEGYVPRYL